MGKIRVLFLCRHNSGRSQMAEALLNGFAGHKIHAESAGLEPKELNPLVIEVMREAGFDISAKQANSVFAYFKEGRLYNYVITLCDNSGFEQCPVFPGVTQRLHWPFLDPEKLTGTPTEKLAALRQIRDQIKQKIKAWITEVS
jgi:arsenate reductase